MTKIEWVKNADGTSGESWNPIIGCSKVSAGCKNCYAERMAARLVVMGNERYCQVIDVATKSNGKIDVAGCRWNGRTHLSREILAKPLRWRKPRMVFVNSMGDLFHPTVPDEEIAAVLGIIAATPQHTYQVLTKRAMRMVEWFAWFRDLVWPESSAATILISRTAEIIGGGPGDIDEKTERWYEILCNSLTAVDAWDTWPLPNLWLGVSVENQPAADERVPLLLQVPAAVRFVSAEPLLGPIDFGWPIINNDPYDYALAKLDLAIIGGENGPNARPCDIEWIRSIVQQCRDVGTPCFVKQLGANPVANGRPIKLRARKGNDPSEWPEDIRVRQMPEEAEGKSK